LELRVQSLQLEAGVGGFELPVGLGVMLVSVIHQLAEQRAKKKDREKLRDKTGSG
jgi:TRAP-type C4-dicarboxylate transport system permease small subunit